MTLRKHQLRRVLRDYAPEFPSWRVVLPDLLCRNAGPVLQGILFDRSSLEEYRPKGFIHVLAAPEGFLSLDICQDLKNPKGAQWGIRISLHEHYFAQVVTAIRKQFRPAVDGAFTREKAYKYYVSNARPIGGEAFSLAFFAAAVGRLRDARKWIEKYQKEFGQFPLSDLVAQHRKTFEDQRKAIDALDAQLGLDTLPDYLDEIIKHERQLIGIPRRTPAENEEGLTHEGVARRPL